MDRFQIYPDLRIPSGEPDKDRLIAETRSGMAREQPGFPPGAKRPG